MVLRELIHYIYVYIWELIHYIYVYIYVHSTYKGTMKSEKDMQTQNVHACMHVMYRVVVLPRRKISMLWAYTLTDTDVRTCT